MKICANVLCILMGALLVLALVSSLYIRAGRIVGVEYDNDLVIVEDCAGLTWIYEGVEDLSCGDNVAMLMWNKMTPGTIFDDVILQIK